MATSFVSCGITRVTDNGRGSAMMSAAQAESDIDAAVDNALAPTVANRWFGQERM